MTEDEKNYDLLVDIFSEISKHFLLADEEELYDNAWDALRNPILNLIEERMEEKESKR
jgi:hypothetical protein